LFIENGSLSDDLLWRHLKDLPYFRGLLRAVEAKFYQDLPLIDPILDLGCGDGHFAAMAFERHEQMIGVDPWWGPLQKSVKGKVYRHAIQSLGDGLPFPSNHFNTAISNSVLEHIPDLDPVLAEAVRVLRSPDPASGKPGGSFIFCSPSDNFLPFLSVSSALKRVRLKKLGGAYENFFNRISRHQHCDDPQTWTQRLNRAGLQVDRWWYYFSKSALRALEWGHYFGMPSAIIHAVTRRWILSPTRWNLFFTDKLVRRYFVESLPDKGAYVFFVAHKE
jgi:SAM-dependent methyltransferase